MKILARAGISIVAVAAIASFGQGVAAAEVVPDPTAESVAELQTTLESQGIIPEVSTSKGVQTKEYDVTQPGGPRVVIETTEPAPLAPGEIAPKLRAGFGNGIYLYLNHTDQTVLATGGAAALGIAVCAIPGIGQAGCASAVGALAGAAAYIATNGFCTKPSTGSASTPGELEINYLDFPNPLPSFKCV
ncbi:hypothetical protein [Rhodococcus sp. WMMA185]|uniref:hypothetical protein n=1 Tax=Rhodococcus sp. WMMA185 TaxID=679318 RepID=UPI0012F4EAB0|nr:hypothetical protein [Rhodococcus sp. WMMA185]